MKFLQNKVVLITGAGFSAPAQLPIQDKILKEMTRLPNEDFLNMDSGLESKKFLHAYISVAIYLLKEYSNCYVAEWEGRYNKLISDNKSNERVQEVLQYIETEYDGEAQKIDFNLRDRLSNVMDLFFIEGGVFYSELLKIKEGLQALLRLNDIQISLEDIFTSFDKSMLMRENTANYTYTQMEELQHAVLRLFVYYFSNRVNQHEITHPDYLSVVDFLQKVQKNCTIITTNWDVLLERYLEEAGIQYDYAFNSTYVVDDMQCTRTNGNFSEIIGIPYIKVHGSINWFRCLKCGTLQKSSIKQCGDFLFDDTKEEKCSACGQVGLGSKIVIRPEIITPTMMKTINIQLYNNLWQKAASELREAKKIIFCGYSLPVADFEFRHLLKQNVTKEAKIDVVLYTNDNPDEYSEKLVKDMMPEKRYRDLFARNDCSFFYDGFGEYFRRSV